MFEVSWNTALMGPDNVFEALIKLADHRSREAIWLFYDILSMMYVVKTL